MVRVTSKPDCCEVGKQEPGTGPVGQDTMAGKQPSALEQGHGKTRGQAKVAVAVCIDCVVVSVASAMITAFPAAYAVTVPAAAPGLGGVELVSTGKDSGREESQVTELVRSLTFGEVENVPMARKFPVS